MDDRTAALGILSEEFYKSLVGAETELRVFDALTEGPMPAFFLGFTEGSELDDVYGIDLRITLDIGEVQGQIKSSYTGAEKFVRLNPLSGIMVFTIGRRMTPDVIRQYFVAKLGQWRRQRLARMTRWHPDWMPVLKVAARSYVA